jgi:hypothetical protein
MNTFGCSTDQCDPPLRGGLGLRLDEQRRCTAGFTAKREGIPVLLTAGHCITETWGHSENGNDVNVKDSGGGLETIGKFHWKFTQAAEGGSPMGDFGTVTLTNNRYKNNPGTVYVSANRDQGDPLLDRGRTVRNPNYRIKEVASNPAGYPLCFTGTHSGTKCGYVLRTGLPISGKKTRYAEVQIYNCTEGDLSDNGINRKIKPGDSGGPAFKYGAAKAIITGGKDSTPNNKTDPKNPSCFVYVSGAIEAQTVMGITIDTQ